MDDKVKNYYKNNFLFTGHRMVLPGAGEKFKHSCQHCKYFVTVVGHQETKKVCLAGVKAYQRGHKRVPDSIEIVELMLLLGKETLQELLGKGKEHLIACGTFEQKI
ncbi:hypothetical protein JCM14036_35510 [Desulfotomaculum defluvii]